MPYKNIQLTLPTIKKMIKTAYILTITFLIISLYGCQESEAKVHFSEPIKGRLINLSNKIGDSFQILRNEDTIKYSLYFEKSNDYNYLVKSDTDTVFIGTISKRNELYLLNRTLENKKYVIHALKFTDSTVIGLETEWIQSDMINNMLDSTEYSNLITDTTDVNTIQVDKKNGKEIFRHIIQQLKVEKLINSETNVRVHAKNDSISNQSVTKTIIKNVYPNPFTDNITIELTEKTPSIFKIFDSNGRHIKTSKLDTDKYNMKLPNLKSGIYFLKILNHDLELIGDFKLIKK
jgi:hypothetical protein